MSLQPLRESLKRFRERGGTVEYRPADSPSLIGDVEEQLLIDFPPELRQFYAEFEYLQIGATEVIWLMNLPRVFEAIRRHLPHVPEFYIPIMEDGVGGYYFVVGSIRGTDLPPEYGRVYRNPAGVPDVMEPAGAGLFALLEQVVRTETDRL